MKKILISLLLLSTTVSCFGQLERNYKDGKAYPQYNFVEKPRHENKFEVISDGTPSYDIIGYDYKLDKSLSMTDHKFYIYSGKENSLNYHYALYYNILLIKTDSLVVYKNEGITDIPEEYYKTYDIPEECKTMTRIYYIAANYKNFGMRVCAWKAYINDAPAYYKGKVYNPVLIVTFQIGQTLKPEPVKLKENYERDIDNKYIAPAPKFFQGINKKADISFKESDYTVHSLSMENHGIMIYQKKSDKTYVVTRWDDLAIYNASSIEVKTYGYDEKTIMTDATFRKKHNINSGFSEFKLQYEVKAEKEGKTSIVLQQGVLRNPENGHVETIVLFKNVSGRETRIPN